jgi:hypothetical protein
MFYSNYATGLNSCRRKEEAALNPQCPWQVYPRTDIQRDTKNDHSLNGVRGGIMVHDERRDPLPKEIQLIVRPPKNVHRPAHYASASVFSSAAGFLGMSANMAAPLADSKFLELVFLNKVCGFDLRIG